MAIEKCCEHLCSKEPMAGAPERFERAKATWKEVTGEDVSHLQCPNEAKPEAATFASGVSNESQLGQRTDSPLPYEQQSADWRCGYDAAEQVWHAKTRGMRQQLRELRGPRTEPPKVEDYNALFNAGMRWSEEFRKHHWLTDDEEWEVVLDFMSRAYVAGATARTETALAAMCESCETRPASKWCNGCIVEDHQAAELQKECCDAVSMASDASWNTAIEKAAEVARSLTCHSGDQRQFRDDVRAHILALKVVPTGGEGTC
jgi:hypothetical protein